MTDPKPQFDDPVAEVREWRAKMYKRIGGNLEALARLLERPPGKRDTKSNREERGDHHERKSA